MLNKPLAKTLILFQKQNLCSQNIFFKKKQDKEVVSRLVIPYYFEVLMEKYIKAH